MQIHFNPSRQKDYKTVFSEAQGPIFIYDLCCQESKANMIFSKTWKHSNHKSLENLCNKCIYTDHTFPLP